MPARAPTGTQKIPSRDPLQTQTTNPIQLRAPAGYEFGSRSSRRHPGPAPRIRPRERPSPTLRLPSALQVRLSAMHPGRADSGGMFGTRLQLQTITGRQCDVAVAEMKHDRSFDATEDLLVGMGVNAVGVACAVRPLGHSSTVG